MENISQNKDEEKNGWIVYTAQESGEYDSYIEESYERILGLQISRCGLKENDLVLEVGCATGAFSRRLSRKGMNVVGVDISSKLAGLAQKGSYHPTVADGESLPFMDSTFDHVCCYDLLHHFLDPSDLIGEMFRVLKIDGTLFISDLNGCNPHTFLAQMHLSPVRYDYLNKNESATFPWQIRRIFKAFGKNADFEYIFLKRRKKKNIADWKYSMYGFIVKQIDGRFKRLMAIILFNIAHMITPLLPAMMKSNIVIAYCPQIAQKGDR